MSARERDRRLQALEASAANRRAKVEDQVDWSAFTAAHLRAFEAVTRDLAAGTLTGDEAGERLAAVPGLDAAMEHSLSVWLAARPPGGWT